MRNKIISLLAAAIVTLIFLTIYISGQQIVRQSVRQPLIQSAQAAALRLDNGVKPNDVVPTGIKVTPLTSAESFVVIYDRSGNAVASSGEVDGSSPVIPFGVLQASGAQAYNSVTWQPNSQVRLASVAVSANNYYVVAAESLNEPEKLIDKIGAIVLGGYVGSLLLLLIASFIWQASARKTRAR